MNENNKKPAPKNLIRFFLGILPFIILALAFSCEEDPSELGANLLPDGDKIQIHYDTSLTFSGSVLDNKPMHTTNLSYYTLGIYEDNYFGSFKGEYVGQFYPSSSIENVSEISVDSAFLYLNIDSIYGFSDRDNIYFNIYELNTDIVMDSVYYTNTEIDNYYLEENPINTNSIISGDTLLKFPLSYSFANRLISQGDIIYDSDSAFRENFKGITIIPELINSSGGLIVANIASAATKLSLYYHTADEDSLIATYSLSSGYRFAKYTNDYQSGLVNNFITNPENENDSLIFVQGLNGVRSKIQFSNIKEWQDQDSSYSILNAELTIPVFDDNNPDAFPTPNNLFFYYSDADSNLINISDYAEGMFGGTYDKTNSNYKFNISKHLMNLLNGSIQDSCLNFAVYNKSYYPNRVILKSGKNIKLNVTYTKH